MTAPAAPAAPAAQARVLDDIDHNRSASATSVALAITGRGLRLLPRMPQAIIPAIVFPVILTVSFSGLFAAVGESTGGIDLNPSVLKQIDWVLPFALLQGSCFSGIQAAFGIARDLESGFYDRLLLAPTRRYAFLIGVVLMAMIRVALPFVLVLACGFIVGARMTDVLGLVPLAVAGIGAATVYSLYGAGIAYRVRSVQKGAPLMFLAVFSVLFTSTATVPLERMEGTWLHPVAQFNPMTQVLRLARQGFVDTGVRWEDTWPGVVVMVGAAALMSLWALRGLRRVAG